MPKERLCVLLSNDHQQLEYSPPTFHFLINYQIQTLKYSDDCSTSNRNVPWPYLDAIAHKPFPDEFDMYLLKYYANINVNIVTISLRDVDDNIIIWHGNTKPSLTIKLPYCYLIIVQCPVQVYFQYSKLFLVHQADTLCFILHSSYTQTKNKKLIKHKPQRPLQYSSQKNFLTTLVKSSKDELN